MSAPGWRLPTPRPGGPTYPPLTPALHPGLLHPGPATRLPAARAGAPTPQNRSLLPISYSYTGCSRSPPASGARRRADHVLRAQAHLHRERAVSAHARFPTPQPSHSGSRKVTVLNRAAGSLLGPPCLCPRRPRPPHWHPRARARSAPRCKWRELGRVGLGGRRIGGLRGTLAPDLSGHPSWQSRVISSGCVWPFSPAPAPPQAGNLGGCPNLESCPNLGGFAKPGARAG